MKNKRTVTTLVTKKLQNQFTFSVAHDEFFSL